MTRSSIEPEKSAQELNDEAREHMRRIARQIDPTRVALVEAAEAKRAETVKLAGVGARDRGHTMSGLQDYDDLWACISALAKRVKELERRK